MQERRICVTSTNGEEDWNNVTVNRQHNTIEGRYKAKHQITIELRSPYVETITIESTEPFTNVEDFAREMLIAADFRHRARRKQFIADNKSTLRDTIIPLWLAREAFTARHKAKLEGLRKESKRMLCKGTRDLNTHNNFVRSLKNANEDEDYTDLLAYYKQRINSELQRLNAPEGFYISSRDMNEFIDRNWWEQFLEINKYEGKQRYDILSDVRHDMELFNRLYGLKPESITAEYLLDNYDSITTAGFDDVVLAATLKKDEKICAVMAIDNEQGRRALRRLVGEGQLAELLPKRILNAIIRHEDIEIHDMKYTPNTQQDILIME
jgi:hypothetical protein